MYKLKLVKGLSYTVGGPDGLITATVTNPEIEVPDAMAEGLLRDGNFEIVTPGAAMPAQEAETVSETDSALPYEPEYGGKTLDEMTTAEIETFATYKNVSLKGLRKKNAMIAKLRAELPAEELEGIIEYGSPTMVELQEK